MKRFTPTHRYQLETLEARCLLTTYALDLGPVSPADINASDKLVGTSHRADCSERAFLW
jgi:hypothetical protein